MDKPSLISQLKTTKDLKQLTPDLINNPQTLNLLFDIVRTEPSSIKYGCSKLIRYASEQTPELIYPYFDEIVNWLHQENSFIKWDGILVLSNLASVDTAHKFESIFEEYFALIHSTQMITAGNVIGNAWKIALTKPELESAITKRLLEVPNIVYLNKGEPSPECNCIVSGQVLESFDHYFEKSSHQKEMLDFAHLQLSSTRKSVVKKAQDFIKRHVKNQNSPLFLK